MKIMLQQIADRQVYAGRGVWVTDLNDALCFDSMEDGIDFAIKEQLFGVQVLIHLDSAHMDWVVPCCILVSSLKPCEA